MGRETGGRASPEGPPPDSAEEEDDRKVRAAARTAAPTTPADRAVRRYFRMTMFLSIRVGVTGACRSPGRNLQEQTSRGCSGADDVRAARRGSGEFWLGSALTFSPDETCWAKSGPSGFGGAPPFCEQLRGKSSS